MKEYFTPVEFPELDPPKNDPPADAPPPTETGQLKTEMADFHAIVMALITAIRSGESLIAPSVQLKGSGLLNAIERMRQFPSKSTIQEFLDVGAQDINRRFSQECETMLKAKYTFSYGKAPLERFPMLRRVLYGE